MSAAAGSSPIRVSLSTSSVYPLGVEAAFQIAGRLGYDGVEVMVLGDPLTQQAATLNGYAEKYDVPILSIHAPTLLVTQRVWGSNDPWVKIDRSIELAYDVGAEVVVVHPPFRWQRDYAEDFTDGVALRENQTDMPLAVENMFPWRARNTDIQAYLPHWDPVPQPYDNVTLDLSHTATSGSDALKMQAILGDRLRHVHLGDGTGTIRDEHLVPGRGTQPCDEFLARLGDAGFDGVVCVEVGTRKRMVEERDLDLLQALAFARLHLGHAPEWPIEPVTRHVSSQTTMRAGAARRRERRDDRKRRRAARRDLFD